MLTNILKSAVISAMLVTSAEATCRPADSFVTRLNEVPIIMNDPEAGWHDLYLYEKGTTCFVHRLGKVDKLGADSRAVLVTYTPSHKVSLRECPAATEYLMTPKEYENACRADTNLNYQEEIRLQLKSE